MEIGRIVRTLADVIIVSLILIIILQLIAEPRPETAYVEQNISEPLQIREHPPTEQKIPEKPVVLPTNNYTVHYPEIEKNLHDLVNTERTAMGRDVLEWNDDIAAVAREHSENLAKQNEPFTEPDLLCYMPLVHHEGFDFGLYQNNRLENRSIYYFSSSGENIFVVSLWKSRKTFDVDENDCEMSFTTIDDPAALHQEIEKRTEMAEKMQRVKWMFTWSDQDEIEHSIVEGWMESPGHRANILNENYTETGIGVAKANDFYIVTQVFIQRVECGYRNGPCCVGEDYLYCYAPNECIKWICYKVGS